MKRENVKPVTPQEFGEVLNSYMSDGFTELVKIRTEEYNTVGVMIVSRKGGNCHPQCDYHILSLFIDNAYRNKNIATENVLKYIEMNPGVYSLDIENDNEAAKNFWKKVIKVGDLETIELPEVRDLGDIKDQITLLGFRTKQQNRSA